MSEGCRVADTREAQCIKEDAALGQAREDDTTTIEANCHAEEMPRQFHWTSALALGFSITNTWVGYLSNFGQNLVYGGPQVCLFSLFLGFAAQMIITVGLSELASSFPSTGGQYHFCFILSPKKSRRFAGFVVGWMSVVAWWIVTCAGIALAADSVTGIAHFWVPGFVPNQWQTYLIFVGTSFVTLIPIFIAPNRVSWIVQAGFYLSIVGFFLFFIILLGMHQESQPSEYILRSGQGTSGWSEGTAWMLAITNAMFPFGGPDAAIHISDEVKDPGRRIPQVMIMTLVIGLITCFPLFVILMSFMKDMNAVINSPLPCLELVYQITESKSATTFLAVWLSLVYFYAIPSQWITCGRMAWAFAQDNGLPFSEYFSRIDPVFKFPVRTTIAGFGFTCIYGLLYLASTTAFNSIVTTVVLFLNITYVVPQGILLVQGRSRSLPSRHFNLGYVGLFCNIFSVLYIVILGTFLCFPPSLPVTKSSMSYSSPVVVGIFMIIIGMWFMTGRKNFKGPNVDCEMIKKKNTN